MSLDKLYDSNSQFHKQKIGNKRVMMLAVELRTESDFKHHVVLTSTQTQSYYNIIQTKFNMVAQVASHAKVK